MGLLDRFRSNKTASASKGVNQADAVEDPVCHMHVVPGTAAGTSNHGSTTYAFCSTGCKQRFDKDPHQFLGAHSH